MSRVCEVTGKRPAVGFVFQILDIAKRSGVGDIALLDKSTKSEPGKPANGDATEGPNPR